MHILLIDPLWELERALRSLGHTVTVLRPGPGVFHLPGILRHMSCAPDFVLQQECLGPRAFLGGLESLDCPTAFWAVDSHLNMFWHQWYALLFDAVLTPHMSLFRSLPADRRPRELRRFAWPGQRRQWIAHNRRTRDMSLCARLDAHRPVRGWLAELLLPIGLHLADNLSLDAMMRLYDDSRLVPNESIANEVNFRLLEGASSGCLVCGQDVGEDQNALLAPDKEFLIYHDGLELLEQAAWAKKRPKAVEAMGRAAMLRVQAEHLPEHRAAALLRLAEGLTQNRLAGRAASLAFWIVLALQIRNLRMDLAPHEHARQGLSLVHSLPPWPDLPLSLRPFVSHAIAQSLCLFAENPCSAGGSDLFAGPDLLPGGGVVWPVDEAVSLGRNLLAATMRQESPSPRREVFSAGKVISETDPVLGPEDAAPLRADTGDNLSLYACPDPVCTLELASIASAFFLRQGRFSPALAFWLHYAGKDDKSPPRDPVSLCLRWAAAWERQGNIFTAGASFVPEKGFLPENALHCLTFGQALNPEAARLLARRSASLLADRRDLLFLRIGCLADACLADQEDWRIQLEYGLACLQACRVEAGMFEVREARSRAIQEGKSRIFQSRISAWPGGRRVWEAVRGGPAEEAGY